MTPRTCITLFVAVSAVALVGCQKNEEEQAGAPAAQNAAATDPRTIHLGDIIFTPAAGPAKNTTMVQSSFTFGAPGPGEQSIVTDGHGGACLLQQENKLCSGAQDKDKGAAECSPPAGGWGYCLDRKNMPNGTQQGQCWIKGGPDCLRAPRENDGKLLAEGVTYRVPKAPIEIHRSTKVRLIGCVNGTPDTWPVDDKGAKVPPCALQSSDKRIMIVGPVKQLGGP